MWVTRSERIWRRRAEARQLREAARAAECRFAAFSRAVAPLLARQDGREWLARFGIRGQWRNRSHRMGKEGAEGLSVLESVVLAGFCNRLLNDPSFVRWMSHAQPDSLQAFHAAAGEASGAEKTAADDKSAT